MKKYFFIFFVALFSLYCEASTTFYHYDGNNNVSTLVNNSGQVVGQYSYDPYGNTVAKSGTMSDVNTYRFTAKEVQPTSGMYEYKYRFYNPTTHRWLNQDPIGLSGGRNIYAFVGNDPINGYDPLGLVEPGGGFLSFVLDPWVNGVKTLFNLANSAPTVPELEYRDNGPLGLPGWYPKAENMPAEPSVTSIGSLALSVPIIKFTKSKCWPFSPQFTIREITSADKDLMKPFMQKSLERELKNPDYKGWNYGWLGNLDLSEKWKSPTGIRPSRIYGTIDKGGNLRGLTWITFNESKEYIYVNALEGMGNGAGTSLMQFSYDTAIENGYRGLELHPVTSAQRFYDNFLGFTDLEAHPGAMFWDKEAAEAFKPCIYKKK